MFLSKLIIESNDLSPWFGRLDEVGKWRNQPWSCFYVTRFFPFQLNTALLRYQLDAEQVERDP